jgi:4-methyl-5(b-hydroxyethyl)-thiazole monophosphate biosynthesis
MPLATGFEEIEAVTVTDVLRRGGVDVVLAALERAGNVTGSHGISIEASTTLAAVADQHFDLVVLPGGEPGATHLAADTCLDALLRAQAAAGRALGAICAAPKVLAVAGLLRDRDATSHPSVEAQLRQAGARYSAARVVHDGNIVTSRGPGTALEFTLALLELLGETARAAELRVAMLAHPD